MRTRPDLRLALLRKFGETVRECWRKSGLTQQQLADAIGVSIAYMSLIERGGRNPPFTRVVAIARALKVSLTDLGE